VRRAITDNSVIVFPEQIKSYQSVSPPRVAGYEVERGPFVVGKRSELPQTRSTLGFIQYSSYTNFVTGTSKDS